MRKLVLALLGIMYISGYTSSLFTSDKTYKGYLVFLIGFGIIIIYLLNKVVSKRILTYCQIGLAVLNVLSISGLYIYGYITSNNSFGLGLIVIMLFTILVAQIVLFVVHIGINKIAKNENKELVENNAIVGYTFIFFVLNQVSIPNNYDIPLATWLFIYGSLFVLFSGLSLLIIKVFKKDVYIPLLISLIILIIVQISGLDVNIFLRLPFQIIVMILLIIKFTLNSSKA